MKVPRHDPLPILACAALAAAFTLPLAPQLLRYGAAFALLWLVPAWAWYGQLSGALSVRVVTAVGLAFVGPGLATLVLHLLPGIFPTDLARIAYLALALLPVGMRRLGPQARPDARASRSDASVAEGGVTEVASDGQIAGGSRSLGYLGLVAIAAVSLLVRVPNLGYSEFQGDEAVIMQRAADALAGDDAELFLHQKGPVEILLPMSVWALTGTVSEWQARLPFALAGLLAALTVAALAELWFGPRAGLFAGLLIASNGFLVAFGRIVQYQNLVVAMGGLCLLWLLQAARMGQRRAVILAAIFLAFGLLAHYDAVLVVPAAMAILWDKRVRRVAGRRQVLRLAGDLVIAGIAGAGVLAIFYLPFTTNPMFSRTVSYLIGGRLGEGLFHNSLWDVWRMSTFYNALYYIVGLVLLVLVAAWRRWGNLATWLYAGIPFIFYAFLVSDPRTHVYTFYPGAAVLAGGALATIFDQVIRSSAARFALGCGLGIWYGLSVGFIGMAFVAHRVEYKREWPESRHALYPVPFADDALPPYGHFGFPYRAGWKAVAYLYDRGVIRGTYASNEEPEVTNWYLPGATRTLCGQPDLYIIAERVQDEVAVDWAELEREYESLARVQVSDQTKIRIYGRGRFDESGRVLQARDTIAWYDAQTTVARHRSMLPPVTYAVGADFGMVGRLLGYDLSHTTVARGDALRVTLAWQALSSPERNTQIFVHLLHRGELVAQDDSAPACAGAPTSLWEAGETIRDEHTIRLDATMPVGTYDITVGMYDLLTLTRLPVDGGPSDAHYLAQVEVTP